MHSATCLRRPLIDESAARVADAIALADPITTRVAVATKSAVAFVAAVVGATQVGAAAALVSDRPCREGSFEAEQTIDRLKDAEARYAIGDAAHSAILAEAGFEPTRSLFDDVVLWRRSDFDPAPHPKGTALIVYTSGSLGRPKGVVLTHQAIDWIGGVNHDIYQWQPGDRFLAMLPLTHLAGITNVLSAVGADIDVVMSPSIAFPHRVAETIDQNRISVLGAVPFQLDRLYKTADQGLLASLRKIVSSAAPLSRCIVSRVMSGQCRPELRNAFGLTEAFRCFAHRVDVSEFESGMIGRPLPGVTAKLVHPDSNRLARIGEVGELWLHGPQQTLGYWRRPVATDAALRDGFVRSGDLARVDSRGNFRIVGRCKNVVNRGGEKMTMEAIEAVLEQIAGDPVAVHPRDAGTGTESVVAMTSTANAITLDQLRRGCASKLNASFWPSELLSVPQIPMTRSGKFDRTGISRLIQESSNE